MTSVSTRGRSSTKNHAKHDAHGPFRQSVRWRNFRGFVDTEDLALPELTIVIGPNNAGKSSLLAPLLLLKQSITSNDASRPLITKGLYTDVGTYADFVFGGDLKREITLRLRYHGHDDPPDLTDVKEFEEPPGEVEIGLRGVDGGGLELSQLSVFDMYRRLYLRRRRQADGSYSVEGPFRKAPGVDTQVLEHIGRQKARGFLFGPVDMQWWDPADGKKRQSLDDVTRSGVGLYNAIVGSVQQELRRMLGSLAYIGPMRSRPARFYEHTGENPATVGPRGEHAYEVLFREREKLEPRLNAAIRKLRFADAIECVGAREHSDVFAVKLRMGKLSFNLADAGFGVSQVLPILIQGFRGPTSRRYSRLMIKQPEIHLNPTQQSVFAELAVQMLPATSLIVETHSEHFLLTIRRLIAEGKLAAENVGLYFVEKRAGKRSTVRRVPIGTIGQIEAGDWPAGFMDESVREALALAAAQASRLKAAAAKVSKNA